MNQLMCPMSGEVCSSEICDARKTYNEYVEATGQVMISDALAQNTLPVEVLEALDEAGFCRLQRLEAMEHLAASEGDTTFAGRTAIVLVMIMEESLLPADTDTPPPEATDPPSQLY